MNHNTLPENPYKSPAADETTQRKLKQRIQLSSSGSRLFDAWAIVCFTVVVLTFTVLVLTFIWSLLSKFL